MKRNDVHNLLCTMFFRTPPFKGLRILPALCITASTFCMEVEYLEIDLDRVPNLGATSRKVDTVLQARHTHQMCQWAVSTYITKAWEKVQLVRRPITS